MKKLILCSLVALPLMAQADTCAMPRSKYTSLSSISSNASMQSRSLGEFDDVLGWCSNWITELQQVRWSASLEASNGNMVGAANQLKRALDDKVSEIGQVFPTPAPHTADAIVVSSNILEEVFARSFDMSPRLRDQVRYMMADAVYALIEDAYNDLDRNYYREVLNQCGYGRHGCQGERDSSHLMRSYYDGMRQLAVKILNLQQSVAQYQASDNLELGSSYAVSIGARDILMNSLARRSLSCEIGLLDFTAKQIERFLSCDGSNLSRPHQIRIVRDLLAKAKADLRASNCRNYRY